MLGCIVTWKGALLLRHDPLLVRGVTHHTERDGALWISHQVIHEETKRHVEDVVGYL